MTLNVTLLGTGSPRPSSRRSQPATLITVDEGSVLLDAGDGTVRQIMATDISPLDIQTILFTHMHKDHILGYPGVVWAGWTLGRTNLRVLGPPGTKRMHELLFNELYSADIEYSKGIGFESQSMDDVQVEEIASGTVTEVSGMQIRTVKTIHSFYNLAYRFEKDTRAIVFTGDTTYCEDVVELARDADMLVCEVTLAPSPDYENNRGRRILDLLRKDHCTPEQAGRMA